MNKFVQYYTKEIERHGGLDNYISAKATEKKPFLDRIKKYSLEKKIIETGCGSAANSIFLAQQGFSVICIDKDKASIRFAEENAKNFENRPQFKEFDISELKSLNMDFDVAFSHGVLEHYSDDEIIQLINSQLSVAQYVVISVPSDFFKQAQAINGDERFLPKNNWLNLISQTNGKLVECFDYFYESPELKIRLLKLLSNITFNMLPMKKPYIGFVVGRK